MQRPSPKHIKLNENDVKEYNRKLLPWVKGIEPVCHIVARARNHEIKGGSNVEIDIYLSGLGIPDANKLVLVWSSPGVIDTSSPGITKHCIDGFRGKIDGEYMVVPLTGKEQRSELSPDGVMFNLPEPFFLPAPKSEKQFMPMIMGERNSAGYPPLSISLRTSEKAKPGNYNIDVALTYRYHDVVKQTVDRVEFRVTSWWDRNQKWVGIAGIVSAITAFILLLLTFLNVFGCIVPNS